MEDHIKNSNEFYIKALQYLACSLAYKENTTKSFSLYNENSTKKLEKFILEKRNNIPERVFYFKAGCAYAYTFEEAIKEGIDPFSRLLDIGLSDFEYFIGTKNRRIGDV